MERKFWGFFFVSLDSFYIRGDLTTYTKNRQNIYGKHFMYKANRPNKYQRELRSDWKKKLPRP